MKLSFWTLGMPPWSYTEIAERAASLGYDGVDLRCTKPENRKPSNNGNLSIETSAEELKAMRQAFSEAGVQISSLLCYNRNGHDGETVDWDAVEVELVALAQVATKLGSPQIRVQVWRPEQGAEWDWKQYLDSLGRASLTAVKETPGITAVFENHVGSASALQLLEMVQRLGDARLGVVFSPDHCVVMQENAIELADHYADAIKQVSLADRQVVKEDLGKFDGRYYYVRYETCLMGEGLVPTSAILETLAAHGYDGFVALKWERSERFGHQLPSGEVALSHFIEYMSGLGFAEQRK